MPPWHHDCIPHDDGGPERNASCRVLGLQCRRCDGPQTVTDMPTPDMPPTMTRGWGNTHVRFNTLPVAPPDLVASFGPGIELGQHECSWKHDSARPPTATHKGHQGSCDMYGAAPRPHATTVRCNCHYSGDNASPQRTGDGYSVPQPLAAQGNTWSGPCNGGRPARGAPCTTRRLQCCRGGLRPYECPPPRSTRPRASSYRLYNPLGAHCSPGRGFKPASWSSNLQHEVFRRNELNFNSTPCIDHLYTPSLCYPFPETHTVSGRVDAWSPPPQRVNFALNDDTMSSCSSTADMGVHHPMRRLPTTHKVNGRGTWPILWSPPHFGVMKLHPALTRPGWQQRMRVQHDSPFGSEGSYRPFTCMLPFMNGRLKQPWDLKLVHRPKTNVWVAVDALTLH